jgi:hypothetical protein
MSSEHLRVHPLGDVEFQALLDALPMIENNLVKLGTRLEKQGNTETLGVALTTFIKAFKPKEKVHILMIMNNALANLLSSVSHRVDALRSRFELSKSRYFVWTIPRC